MSVVDSDAVADVFAAGTQISVLPGGLSILTFVTVRPNLGDMAPGTTVGTFRQAVVARVVMPTSAAQELARGILALPPSATG